MTDEEYRAALLEWTDKLINFCADLEGKGFGVERDGFTVKIFVPGSESRRGCTVRGCRLGGDPAKHLHP